MRGRALHLYSTILRDDRLWCMAWKAIKEGRSRAQQVALFMSWAQGEALLTVGDDKHIHRILENIERHGECVR